MPDAPAAFGDLLRRFRVAADFSQGDLAERASLSATAVSALERGVRRAPYRETVTLLADALSLSEGARLDFFGAAERARSRGARGDDLRRAAASRLPTHLTSFVGRVDELAVIAELLEKYRLVTVTGSGGIGKTRTSLEVCARLQGERRDSVCFVDFAPLVDGAPVVGKVAAALGVVLAVFDDPLASLVTSLKNRRLLLFLDNCEHVIVPAAATAAAILHGCPNISIVATSRERLGIAGEAVYRLPTLPVPERDVTLTAAKGRSYAALQLFVERAVAAEPRFVLTDELVEGVADICRRVDGIALAIELAAARLPTLGLASLRTRLDERFAVLVGGSRDVQARQQTLLATIAWSYDLSTEQERTMLRRLAIFAGGWTLDAAEFVCAGDASSLRLVADVLSSLVEKSLVTADVEGAVTRYRLLESTRAFAQEKLEDVGERSSLARRHAQWLARFATSANISYLTTARHTWLRAVEPELDNARVALEWALGPGGDPLLAGRIAGGLYGAWWTVGVREEGRHWVEAALARVDDENDLEVVAALLGALAGFGRGNAKMDAAERAAALFERLHDPRGVALSYKHLSLGLAHTGRYEEAEAAIDRSAALYRAAGMHRSLIFVGVLADRGAILLHRGRIDDARVVLAEALDLGIALGDDWRVASLRNMLAGLAFDAGDANGGVRLVREAIASARRSGSVRDEMYGLCNLACFLLVLGDLAGADTAARDALALGRDREAMLAHVALQHLAAIAAVRGAGARAARVLGYLDAWYRREGCVRDLTERKSYEILTTAIDGRLSPAALLACVAQGEQFTAEEAMDEALLGV